MRRWDGPDVGATPHDSGGVPPAASVRRGTRWADQGKVAGPQRVLDAGRLRPDRPGAGGDADRVPGVDRHDQADERTELVGGEVRRGGRPAVRPGRGSGATRVIDSVSASAARSRASNSAVSRQTGSRASRWSVSPAAGRRRCACSRSRRSRSAARRGAARARAGGRRSPTRSSSLVAAPSRRFMAAENDGAWPSKSRRTGM